jgi:RHS repeat-associated protein
LGTEVYSNLTNQSFSYSDVNGNTQNYTLGTSSLQVGTTFDCINYSGQQEPADLSFGLRSMPTSVSLPDSSQYSISYETNSGGYTGRIASITLPTGGSVSYAYRGSNKGFNCNYFTAPEIDVTVADGRGNSDKFTYVSSLPTQAFQITPALQNFTVIKTDTQYGNQSVYNFWGEYQTEVLTYQGGCPSSIAGCGGGGTLLKTATTCYNGNNSSQSGCIAPGALPTLPITQTDVYTSIGSMSPSLVETVFDNYGNVTALKKWGFGATYPPSGTPLSETDSTYANVNGVTCGISTSTYIQNHPCTVSTYSSGTLAAQVQYTYNSTGHATQTKTLVSGSNYLTSSATYTNGIITSMTDVNNATTTYNYNGGCNNMLLTSTVLPVNSLTTYQSWNCNGGVLTSATDANSQVTQYKYVNANGTADPYWRALQSIDPLQNTTWTIYSGTSIPFTVETILANSTSSSVDSLTTYDGLGRPYLQQTRQAPSSSNFDTVVTAYDILGRVTSVGMPCTAAASSICTSATTTTTYDALNRPLQVTDGGNGYTSYSYAPSGSYNNDVLVTVGPAPSGENLKKKQLEYDGLGRLTSVCELTGSANGGGTCGQNAPQVGYWTTYSYDGINRLQAVSQSAQSSYPQSRLFSYDGLSRLTSESNPESGTTNYTYDSDTTCGTYNGDLVKKVDAVGNVSCFKYDAIHRKTAASYPSGAYAANTPAKTFVYDATTFSCSNGANVMGRLAEAYTGSSSSKTTDIAYCYSARGETTDAFESTPNSVGYYHTTASYLPTGGLSILGGVPGLNSWNFSPDGEGRLSSVTYGTSTNWVTGTQYYPTYTQTKVTFGNGDNDAYGYDQTTGRMNSFQFTVGSSPQTLSGSPGWNPNGTLGTLNITDPFNSSNTQNCGYVYDDLARINSVNCVNGSTPVFNQSFTLDPFGNLSKSGSITFAANYVLANGTTNNQEQSVASCVPTYDANGNTTKDCSFSSPPKYQWDSDGNPIQVRSSSLTFDALDREVEFANGSAITQVLYGPIGKVGLMNGQTPSITRIPLPGGSTAKMVGTSGVTYILHNDWLGSARLTTAYSTRSMYYDTAYAPYGENYSSTSSSTSNLDFTGQFQDTMTGLYDFLYREDDPVQGRWISPDPAGLNAANPLNPQTWNRYVYVTGNPMNNIDPTGLEPTDASSGCVASQIATHFCPAAILDDYSNSNCQMDGIANPCSMVYSMLQSGAAALCPDNDCGRVRVDRDTGQWEQIIGWDFRNSLNLEGQAQNKLVPIWEEIPDPIIAEPLERITNVTVSPAERQEWGQLFKPIKGYLFPPHDKFCKDTHSNVERDSNAGNVVALAALAAKNPELGVVAVGLKGSAGVEYFVGRVAKCP